MNSRLQDLALRLVELPEWLAVSSVAIESASGMQRVPVPFSPERRFPVPEGKFTIHIEVRPDL